ncbi:MAG: lysyl oxidase family protein, partial [Acidimicrobiia bacterium]|nr:lysyl oxidase family protein [Acidimicrobiia bacterium]
SVVEAVVVSGADDVEELASGALYVGSSDLELGENDGPQAVGLRFASVGVPAGAEVVSARLRFTVDEAWGGGSSLVIAGVAESSAAPWSGSGDVRGRAVTAASVSWSPPAWTVVGAEHVSPDLSSVVAEVVGGSGWVSGNAVGFVITGSGTREAESFEGGAPPVLVVEYVGGTPDPDPGEVLPGDRLPDLISDPPGVGDQEMSIGDPEFPALDGRLLLRFDGYVTNVGDGPLHVTGNPQHRDPADPNSHDVQQWVEGGDGILRPLQPVPIQFEDDDDHDHFHVMEIVRYTLWDAARTEIVTDSVKVGFCLEDTEPYPGFENPGPQTYIWSLTGFCSAGDPDATALVMGVTEGWRDVYGVGTNLQWIDVSEIVPGEYWIGAEADPEGVIAEKDEVNPLAFAAEVSVVPGHRPEPLAMTAGGDPVEVTLVATRFESDLDGAPAVGEPVFRIVTAPEHGTLSVAVGEPVPGGVVTYTPDAGFAGTDTFTFSVRDASSTHPTVAPAASVELSISP